jgi:hypothetical protein
VRESITNDELHIQRIITDVGVPGKIPNGIAVLVDMNRRREVEGRRKGKWLEEMRTSNP